MNAGANLRSFQRNRRYRRDTGKPVVLLANPANDCGSRERSVYANLGLLTIATAVRGVLADRDCDVWYHDASLLGQDDLFALVTAHAHRIIVLGLSTYTYNYRHCLKTAKALKALNPDAVVMLGNDHFSARWRAILENQSDIVDCGFVGNDVVEGVAAFVRDLISDGPTSSAYPGIAFRSACGPVNFPEAPVEYDRLPPVDYGIQDSASSHRALYRNEQRCTYPYVRDADLEIGLVDIARGCLKFSGRRSSDGVPLNACEFCGIVPGAQALAKAPAARAWNIIRNAVDHGYNYLFVTADELPWTFWPLLRDMSAAKPEWYLDLHVDDRPRLMCYARADAFQEAFAHRFDVLQNELLFDHFFLGLDGLTERALSGMNKSLVSRRKSDRSLLEDNLRACRLIRNRGVRLTAGMVLTYVGATPHSLKEGYDALDNLLQGHSQTFVELDFELLCPIPGSLAYGYLCDPQRATERASALGVNVNASALEAKASTYTEADFIDPETMINDFIEIFCPELTRAVADEYVLRTRDLAERHGVVYECGSL